MFFTCEFHISRSHKVFLNYFVVLYSNPACALKIPATYSFLVILFSGLFLTPHPRWLVSPSLFPLQPLSNRSFLVFVSFSSSPVLGHQSVIPPGRRGVPLAHHLGSGQAGGVGGERPGRHVHGRGDRPGADVGPAVRRRRPDRAVAA